MFSSSASSLWACPSGQRSPRAAQDAQQKGMAHFLQSRRAQFRLHRIPMRLMHLVFQHTQIHVQTGHISAPLRNVFQSLTA